MLSVMVVSVGEGGAAVSSVCGSKGIWGVGGEFRVNNWKVGNNKGQPFNILEERLPLRQRVEHQSQSKVKGQKS